MHCRKQKKWFRVAQLKVGGCVMLAVGRPLPASEEPCLRMEAEAIMLAGPAIQVWRSGESSGRHEVPVLPPGVGA